jgi:PIN domain nuclease of toxin-antitoxin system
VEESDFRRLAVGFEHAAVAGALPRHHDDPFDRMLVAQAQHEGLTIVTGDVRIGRYQVPVLAAVAEA